jgi:acylphosphatase
MSAQMISGTQFIVRGRVQGVGFRAATRAQALQLNLTGFAHNCVDGSVRVQAFGDASALLALRSWLQRGPRFARVDEVLESPCVVDVVTLGFAVGDD